MVRLSKRLQALGNLVSPNLRLCDVGCDHGFLPIALVQQDKITRALAVDVKEGPLSAAREHIAEAGLQEVIATRLSDGLQAVQPDEAQCILIAGMGGALVMHILSSSPQVAKNAVELVLQPQSEIADVRRYLYREGYRIRQEDMVWEDGKFYPMMKVVYAPEVCVQPDEVQLTFGPDLIAKAHPVLLMYLQQEVRRQSAVLQQLECSPPGEAIEKRRREVEDYGRLLEEGIRRCTGAKA